MDNIERELEIRKSTMHHMRAMADMYGRQASKAASKPKHGAQASSLRSLKRGMDRQADSIHSEIVKIEKKLEKLHRFSAGTQGLFENSLQDWKSAITGVTTLTKEMENNRSGKTNITLEDFLNMTSSVSTTISNSSSAIVGALEAQASVIKMKRGIWHNSAVKNTKSGLKTWKQVNGDVNRFKKVKAVKQIDSILNGTGKIPSGLKGAAF